MIEELTGPSPSSYGITTVGPRHLHDKDDVFEDERGRSPIVAEGTLRKARRLFSENGPAALPTADAAGFHPWRGGSVPVQPYAVVAVRFRGGLSVQASAFRFDWEHTGGNDDVVAFHVVA